MDYLAEEIIVQKCPECGFTMKETIDPLNEVCTLCIGDWEEEMKESEVADERI